jgi:signal transduction histidine kinase
MRVVTRSGEERIWALAREATALRSVAQLARAAGHEINNPLAIVVGQLEMLTRSMVENADAVARIDIACEAARRIAAIVSRTARITRLERADVSAMPPMLDLRGSSRDGERPA